MSVSFWMVQKKKKVSIGVTTVCLCFSRYIYIFFFHLKFHQFKGLWIFVLQLLTFHSLFAIWHLWSTGMSKPSDTQCVWCISGAPEYSVVTVAWLCQTHWMCKIIDSLHRCMISGITEVYQSWDVCICGNSRTDTFQTHCTYAQCVYTYFSLDNLRLYWY